MKFSDLEIGDIFRLAKGECVYRKTKGSQAVVVTDDRPVKPARTCEVTKLTEQKLFRVSSTDGRTRDHEGTFVFVPFGAKGTAIDLTNGEVVVRWDLAFVSHDGKAAVMEEDYEEQIRGDSLEWLEDEFETTFVEQA